MFTAASPAGRQFPTRLHSGRLVVMEMQIPLFVDINASGNVLKYQVASR